MFDHFKMWGKLYLTYVTSVSKRIVLLSLALGYSNR